MNQLHESNPSNNYRTNGDFTPFQALILMPSTVSQRSAFSCGSANQPLTDPEALPPPRVAPTNYVYEVAMLSPFQQLTNLLKTSPIPFIPFQQLFQAASEHLTLENLQDLHSSLETNTNNKTDPALNAIHALLQHAKQTKTHPPRQIEAASSSTAQRVKAAKKTEKTQETAAPINRQLKNKIFDIAAEMYNTAWTTWDEADKSTDKNNRLYGLAQRAYRNYREWLLTWKEEDQRAYILAFPSSFNLKNGKELNAQIKSSQTGTLAGFIDSFIEGQLALIHRAPEKTPQSQTRRFSLFSKAAKKQAATDKQPASQSKRHHR